MAESEPTPSVPHQADDPEAPYFETLYAVAQRLQPGITRAEALATLREADPDDTLRIKEPLDRHPSSGQCGECKATINTEHGDGCSWQYSEKWVSVQAIRTGTNE